MALLCQRGAFVLQVNYHGSGHYGLAWAESIGGGHYYDLEIPDLEAGVDAMIARGLVDPERLGTLGWSNGGILSVELITRSRRYKAASIGAADVEWISDWGNVDFGAAFDNYYLGASPLEDPQVYFEKSPFFRLAEVTTPTVVYTGTEDRNVPPSQSWSLYRALQQHGSAPVRLVLFPGEPHGLRKWAHQKRKVEEDLAWFDRHLFGTGRPAEEALKPASPLAVALSRGRAARVGGRLGVEVAGQLAPEVVEVRGLLLGRFEVTRAQYTAFDGGRRYPAGTDDLPATGLTFEQAQRYAAWLSRATGSRYRLPTQQEMEPLVEAARGRGNTLDHWAGYAPTPGEADRLRREAARLGGEDALLSEVGRFDALTEGAAAVFDLGGNAAEWVVASDGAGKLTGGSADLPSDPKAESEAAPAYRGFRVVRE
jgi:formylglycine-generating enzyme required for sulfatase activity